MMKLSCGYGSHISSLIAIGIPESVDDTCGDVIEGEEIVDWTMQRARVAAAAVQVGVSERALEITVAFLKEREQMVDEIEDPPRQYVSARSSRNPLRPEASDSGRHRQSMC